MPDRTVVEVSRSVGRIEEGRLKRPARKECKEEKEGVWKRRGTGDRHEGVAESLFLFGEGGKKEKREERNN